MKTSLTNAAGKEVTFPLFDPLVSSYFNNPASLTDTLIDQINKENIYQDLFKDRKDLTFLDIGANIGLVSIYAAPACKRIVALEPAPTTFGVLKAMTAGESKIEAVQAALAPTDGPQDFYWNYENLTASSTVNTFGDHMTVNGFKLSSIFKIYQLEEVDIVKIDAEGSEGESLTYEELKFAAPIVKQWFIETHNCPKTTYTQKMGALVGYFVTLGYAVNTQGMTLTAIRI